MIPKKNPKADLQKNSTTYFLIGLVLLLFITWRAIELKTYEREIDLDQLSVLDDDDEDIPITEMKITPPPPPPPAAPQVIEVVEDEEEVEETVIESTETDQEEIIEVEEVFVEEEEEDIEVPFTIIEDIPIFPGLKRLPNPKEENVFRKRSINILSKTLGIPKSPKKWV